MPYKLPDDAVLKGHRETRPCYWEPFFHSPSKNFTGTEEEFYEEGHACLYIEYKDGRRSMHLSAKALKDAGLI